MKRYFKYKQSGVEWIGEIPEKWNVVRLKWVCKFEYGSSLAIDDREEGVIPVYGSNGIIGFHSTSITNAPCIIVGRKGSFGKINWSFNRCFPIDTTYFIDKEKTTENLRWLYYVLLNLELDSFSKDTGVPGLNRDDAYNKMLPQPSIEEQIDIANYLDDKTTEIDKLIEKKKKLIELLNEERTAVINQAVTKGINPKVKLKNSDIEWLGEIPEHWEVKKLKYLVKTISKGTTPSTIGGELLNEGNIRFLKAENILPVNSISFYPEFYISEQTNEVLKRSELKEYDILMVIAGATIGKNSIVTKEYLPANTNQAVCFIRLDELKYVNWVWLFLQSYFIKQNIQFTSVQAAQPNLSMENISNFQILIPEYNEIVPTLNYIESKTKKIDDKTYKTEREIELLKEYRTALISEVVTGKVKVCS